MKRRPRNQTPEQLAAVAAEEKRRREKFRAEAQADKLIALERFEREVAAERARRAGGDHAAT